MAIGMRLKPSEAPLSPERSKFFGSPTMPIEWGDDFYDDTMFFCQINLEELAPFDTAGFFKKDGFLYVFFDTEGGEYSLLPIIRYSNCPTAIFDGFNSEVVGFEQYTNEVEIEFYETDDYADGMRLLGYPTAWQYGEEAPRLLMQIDHLDAGLGFLDHLDGYTYLALGDDVDGFSDVTLIQDYS